MRWSLGIFHKNIENKEKDQNFLQLVGPISLFCTLLLGLQRGVNFDLFGIGLIGLILCSKARIRGLVYSLFLLLIGSLIKHSFFIEDHLWELGLEVSMAIGYAMTAAAAEMAKQIQTNLIGKNESQAQTIHNLEEDLAKVRQDAQDEQIQLRDRIVVLQKECDDFQSTVSSNQILNDVLRKNTAQMIQERDEIALKVQEAHLANQTLMSKIEEHKKEIARLILEQSNHALIIAEKTRFAEEILAQKTAIQEHMALLEKERNALLGEKQHLEALVCSTAKESQQEKERWVQKTAEHDQAISFMQERLQALSQFETKYLELKKQFDEKNQVLHLTRSQFFLADTMLLASSLEKEQNLEPSMAENSLLNELATLENERFELEQENHELFDLVGSLINEKPMKELIKRLTKTATKPKRKKKASPPTSEQSILF